jgi:hypothetical protein
VAIVFSPPAFLFFLFTFRTMKKLTAACFTDADTVSLNAVSTALDGLQKHRIDVVPWPAYAYQPKVQFSIAYNANALYVKYYVQEHCIRAVNNSSNAPVYEDSCVEFFIAFDEEGYYNFEFNCIGTCLAAFGKDREHRTFLNVATINKIQYSISLEKNTPEPLYYWQLTLIIPLSVFTQHSIQSLQGKTCRANFYKCGDALPDPHFLTWSPVQAPAPDFHLPQFFGALHFDAQHNQ